MRPKHAARTSPEGPHETPEHRRHFADLARCGTRQCGREGRRRGLGRKHVTDALRDASCATTQRRHRMMHESRGDIRDDAGSVFDRIEEACVNGRPSGRIDGVGQLTSLRLRSDPNRGRFNRPVHKLLQLGRVLLRMLLRDACRLDRVEPNREGVFHPVFPDERVGFRISHYWVTAGRGMPLEPKTISPLTAGGPCFLPMSEAL